MLPPHLAPVSDTSPTSIELGPAVLAPPSCPCDELDWMCRQDHEPACRNGAPQSEAVPTADPFSAWAPVEGRASRTPRSTPTERDRGPDLDPRGVALQFGVGIGGCNQDFCEENKLSMLGRVGVGYRLPRIAFMASTMLGGGPKLDGPGGVLFTETDFGIDVFFLRNAVVDPFIGAGVGYMRVVVTHSDHSFTDGGVPTIRDTSYYSRGAARVGAGVPFRVGRGWTMGPRFDYTWGFLGERCMRRHVSCTDTRELLDRAGTREGRRRERADHPQPWSLMLEFRRQF